MMKPNRSLPFIALFFAACGIDAKSSVDVTVAVDTASAALAANEIVVIQCDAASPNTYQSQSELAFIRDKALPSHAKCKVAVNPAGSYKLTAIAWVCDENDSACKEPTMGRNAARRATSEQEIVLGENRTETAAASVTLP